MWGAWLAVIASSMGHILAYCSDGALLYSGGITAARADRTNGPSSDALEKIVTVENKLPGNNLSDAQKNKPIFECEVTDA